MYLIIISVVTNYPKDFLDDSEPAAISTSLPENHADINDNDEIERYVQGVTEWSRKRRCIDHEAHTKMLQENSASTSLWRVRCKVSILLLSVPVPQRLTLKLVRYSGPSSCISSPKATSMW